MCPMNREVAPTQTGCGSLLCKIALLPLLSVVASFSALAAPGPVQAIDLGDPAACARQPQFSSVSSEGGVCEALMPGGNRAYRFRVTKPWFGELPKWPSVNLVPTVTDWRPYDRLVIDFFNEGGTGDQLGIYLSEKTGRLQDGLYQYGIVLQENGYERLVISLRNWPAKTDPSKIGRVHFFLTAPMSANLLIGGLYLLKPGEEAPAASARFLRERIEPGRRRREAARAAVHAAAADRFAAACRAAGQTGSPAWFGVATSMENIRPRDDFSARPLTKKGLSLKLARGETEAVQLLVMPNGRDLAGVSVTARVPGIDDAAFKVSPVGYAEVRKVPPYRAASNVATNLPGGYLRRTHRIVPGWHADPILDYLDAADVKGLDVQSFWVSLKCPRDQKAGTYRGTLVVRAGETRLPVPFAVRVWNFEVPVKSPLPLAVSFGPQPTTQYGTAADLKLAGELRADPNSPINAWRKHSDDWVTFLADHYLTPDSLYHRGGKAIRWDALVRLQKEGRLGRFNLGYWNYPKSLDERTIATARAEIARRYDDAVEKARRLGLLKAAYLYGCDEVAKEYFPAIRVILDELKARYPDVQVMTTAYDSSLGLDGSPLAKMDAFCPTTTAYAKIPERIAASRAAGHQVWWYIACGERPPYANIFVDSQAIEPRMLMGAQTAKFRPDGFLYYATSIWNSRRCISGPDTFTDWNPRSWTTYHGDGSLFCCGPDGRPLSTIRAENFRDGLEDYAYVLEYERRTGRRAEVPVEVCRAIDQFTDDPAVYYAWRDRLAESIE